MNQDPSRSPSRRARRHSPDRSRRVIGASVLAIGGLAAGYLHALRQPPAAYALPSGTCIVTDSTDDSVSPASQSLRDCFQQVNASAGDDTIIFDLIGANPTVTLDDSLGYVGDDLTIIGQPGLTITADDTGYRMLQTVPGFADQLTITDVTVSGFGLPYTEFGGAVLLDGSGTLVLRDDTFTNNYSGRGGAVRVVTGNLEVTDSHFASNRADRASNVHGYGGAIDLAGYGGSATIGNSTFSGNLAETNGGAIRFDGTTSITGSVFSTNSALLYGGALFARASLNISTSTFTNNYTTGGMTGAGFQYGGGGAITMSVGLLYGDRLSLVANSAYGPGGAMSVTGYAGAQIENSFFGSNSSTTGAGGLSIDGFYYGLTMRFTTMYDDTSASPTAAASIGIYSGPTTIEASAIGSSVDDTVLIVSGGTLDDSYSISTGTGPGFTGPTSQAVPAGSLDLQPMDNIGNPGLMGRSPSATSPLVTEAPTSDLGTGIGFDQLNVPRGPDIWTIGARQVTAGPGPNPPAPTAPGAPRDVTGVPGTREVEVTWRPPANSGSFPITTYRVIAQPGGASCLATAPALTCTVTGLVSGVPYVFGVTALSAAGYGPSAFSSPITPITRSLTLDQGTRVAAGMHDRIRTTGSSVGIPAGVKLTPHIRYTGQSSYTRGKATIIVASDGTFRWTRKISKARGLTAYVSWQDTTSNTVFWARVR